MRIGVNSTSTLPGRTVPVTWRARSSRVRVTIVVILMVTLVLGPLFQGTVVAESHPGSLMRLEPVRTPYWIRCDSGDAVVHGNLTPAPLTSSDRTSEIDVPGPTFPRTTLSRAGTFELPMRGWYWDYVPLKVYSVEHVSVWAKSREDVENAQFRVMIMRNGVEMVNMYTEIKDLDGTPTELKVTDLPTIDDPLIFEAAYPLEVEIQYRASSRIGTGPAPDCVILTGSRSYPSRVELMAIPMNIVTDLSIVNEEYAYVRGIVQDSSLLDYEEDLQYELSIFGPSGEMVNPLAIEVSSKYSDYSGIKVVWLWYYNLTDNQDGVYQLQVDVTYGVKGVHYSNMTLVSLAFDDHGTIHLDYDGDGYTDNVDEFPWDPDEWADSDEDGVGDNSDDFPHDANETKDTDGDNHGDNSDVFPLDPTEWCDTDGDGYGDNCDRFPGDDTEWKDTDNDGYGDNYDLFPMDGNEWADTDSDGVGDNGDAFPEDDTEWKDTDNDGRGDNSDKFPADPSEWADRDGDGHGDNSDEYPDDITEWKDTDEDGYGDNSDDFPFDANEWSDSDGDGPVSYTHLTLPTILLV